MKVNLISKLQQGGVYTPPFVVYQPIPSASERTGAVAASASGSQSSKDLTDKDILQMLEKMDGLPSDMAVITKNLKSFYVDQLGGPAALNGSASSTTAVRYLTLLNQIKVANFNKKEYDNAWQRVTSNGGLDEVAIDDRGYFICVDEKGDYQRLTAAQLRDSKGKYTPLTNNDLLRYRAEDVGMANKNQILNVVRNGIGMQEITKQIRETISKLGSSESSEEGYFATKSGRIIQGLKDFEKAVEEAAGNISYNGTVQDLYKYKLLTKEQANQATEALTYIYHTLTPTAQALLKYKTDLTDEGAAKLLQTLVSSTLNTTQHFDIDLVGGRSAKSTTAGSSGKDSTDLKATQLVDMVKSIEGVKSPMVIDRGDGIQMTLMGRQFNLISDASGKPITDTSLANMLSMSGIQGIVKNMDNITFGDQKIPKEALKNITYNNTGAIRVNLPIKADGTVNFDVLDAYQRVEAKIDALGRQPTIDDYRKFYEEEGLSALLKADGTPNPTKFGAFLVTEGYTTDALSGIQESRFVKETKQNTDLAIQTITQSLTVGSGKNATSPKIDKNSIWPGDWFGWYDKIYKAAIYIPIDNSTLAAARLDGQKLDYDEAQELDQRYQDFDKFLRLGSTSAEAIQQ